MEKGIVAFAILSNIVSKLPEKNALIKSNCLNVDQTHSIIKRIFKKQFDLISALDWNLIHNFTEFHEIYYSLINNFLPYYTKLHHLGRKSLLLKPVNYKDRKNRVTRQSGR